MSCEKSSAVSAHNNEQLYSALQFMKHSYMCNLVTDRDIVK